MTANWVQMWSQDIDQMASDLPLRHLNLFHNLTKHDFQAQILALKDDLPDCDDAMVMTRLMAIIASVGDAHTTLIPRVNRYLPFEFYWFAEGLHVIAAAPELREWLGAKVIAVEEQSIEVVIDALTGILSHENQAFVMSLLPSYLSAAELLYGLEICDSTENIQLTLQKDGAKPTELTVKTISSAERRENFIRLEQDLPELPLYRQRRNQSIWFTDAAPDCIYVQYNACRETLDCPMIEVFEDLMVRIDDQQPAKIVIDLRDNGGGDSTLLEPLIRDLSELPVKIFVIIGRNTFSSALLNSFALQRLAGATVVGEPSGGKPNCYGEVQYLTLNNSKMQIRYSTQYYHLIEDDSLLSMLPDLPCPVTFADYGTGQDPCLTAILKL